jgi:iron-sulfur cluster assembly protein
MTGENAMITMTDAAKTEVERLLKEKNDPSWFLRVGVKGGGCSGFTYVVDLDNQATQWDKVFGEYPRKLVCDPKSFVYLDGMALDYSKELVGGGFQFHNPNASGSCGCGKSFSV